MSAFLSAVRPHARLAFSLGGIFFTQPRSLSSLTRDVTKTKYVLRTPSPAASREVPTPLVFLSASGWDRQSADGMETFASMFAEKGFTCLEIDLAPPESEARRDSTELMKHFHEDLRSHVRLAAIPFAPVVVARSGGTLIAQTFVESNPASGLILLEPPESNDAVTAAGALLPTTLPEFSYEPMFPIAVVGTAGQLAHLRQHHRLFRPAAAPVAARQGLLSRISGRGGRGRWSVDTVEVKDDEGVSGQSALIGMETWLDSIGI